MKLRLMILMNSCLIISNNSFAAAKRQNHFLSALHASLKELHASGLEAWQSNPQTALEQNAIKDRIGSQLRETTSAALLLAHSAGNPAPIFWLAEADPEDNLFESLTAMSKSFQNNEKPEQAARAAQSLFLASRKLRGRTPVHVVARWASKNPIEH